MPEKFNLNTVRARQVTIAAAGTAVQGPDVQVPDWHRVVVQNSPTNAAAPVAFVADTQANAQTAANRFALAKGSAVALRVKNFNNLWFDTDTSGTKVDLITEFFPL